MHVVMGQWDFEIQEAWLVEAGFDAEAVDGTQFAVDPVAF